MISYLELFEPLSDFVPCLPALDGTERPAGLPALVGTERQAGLPAEMFGTQAWWLSFFSENESGEDACPSLVFVKH
jgi:hypothetical protein